MATLRLDKFLAQSGERTRKDASLLLKSGQVCVDGQTERDGARKVDAERQEITLAGQPVADRGFQYYLLHKPAGVLTAARDSRAATVMSLVPETLAKRKVLPVGRLDKDTTGLLLLTNDGELAHHLLAPKRHVQKEYHAVVEGLLTEESANAFANGITLSDFIAQPARMQILSATQAQSEAVVWLSEGKFHQVKRMFAACGHPVLRLHRVGFGALRLPEDLPEGKYRELTAAEIAALKKAAQGHSQADGLPT